MKVACCSPEINVPYLGTPRTRFGSEEAHVILQKCSNFKQLKQVHGRIIRFGLIYDQLLMRKLIQFSSSYGKLNYATLVFDQLNSPDTFTWNVMIRAYTISGSPKMALLLFKAMLCQGFAPDKFTYPFVISACVASNALDLGRVTHALAIKMGFWSDLYVQTNLMNLYFKCKDVDDGWKVFDKMRVRNVFAWTTVIAGFVACGRLDTARKLFEKMPSKNVVSWTAMIDGYVKHAQPVKAFNLFERMLVDNVKPNEYTVVSLVRACTEMGSLRLGRRIHDFVLKNDFEIGAFLGTALIDMYSKCGSLDEARKVFDVMQVRTLATWNTMITSLGVHGFRSEAISLFEEMVKANEVPDAITFVGVLSACVYLNDLELAQKYFNLMTDHYGSTLEANHDVAELLHKSKLTNVDDIKKLVQKQYEDLDSSELVIDHSSTSSQPQL
ncbi:hypothetical protein VIGAN_04234600 [Vigna angularis var. angularis]|uniref:Pentacotripeptide-repeat region of PRORP domain-containing protein n=1 Tax=Vigna angularis var. angularis TaxID=157739 RepID=A0A0S3RWR8_PHAAN|nr:hypothetical protein VIGAN_04234600 [Vigna angularis var. angularis]